MYVSDVIRSRDVMVSHDSMTSVTWPCNVMVSHKVMRSHDVTCLHDVTRSCEVVTLWDNVMSWYHQTSRGCDITDLPSHIIYLKIFKWPSPRPPSSGATCVSGVQCNWNLARLPATNHSTSQCTHKARTAHSVHPEFIKMIDLFKFFKASVFPLQCPDVLIAQSLLRYNKEMQVYERFSRVNRYKTKAKKLSFCPFSFRSSKAPKQLPWMWCVRFRIII